MGFWIRSQNKCELFKATNIKVRPNTNFNSDNYFVYIENDFQKKIVGAYKTFDRALEILDDIQGFIESDGLLVLKNLDISDSDIDLEKLIKQPIMFTKTDEKPEIEQINKMKVYQMPKE